ncbi:hypothetical protein CERSUDRAFT_98279 [Gelatoporia subvermispora B]|uniref:Uncharacterized protein n=1 Tax=Ceriporiopsis subvermispora (strain B) TaxID=914234 RepID=M2PD79_CERS8|nr:hypothetical protein CERSUDRAFT_98279 [Gelatoporia subvermispora B]
MGNKHSFLEKDLEEESYNQAVLHYIFNQAPEDGGYGAEPARYTAPLGPYNSFYGTYGEQSPSQGGRPTYSQTIQPLMPSNVAQRPTTPLQSVSPSTTPGDSPLPNRYHSLEPTPLTLPPRPATSPATYPDDENDDNASSRRPTVHVPQTSGNSSPAVLTNHGPTPEPTPQRFPSPVTITVIIVDVGRDAGYLQARRLAHGL